ncbi:MAG: phosphodiester glycosidase family protein [Candidatus Gracilibacteria bacterium]|nr:phosphodiester glycosidase family protein [Candidatus Gracilibacteria bacterium]MDD2908349.1 phosphodiester glycosidase family protein [Candidatus Gracilibacteria bacterium]
MYYKTNKLILKKIIFLIIFLILPSLVSANVLIETNVDGYKIKALKIERNTGYKVIVGVSEKGESLDSMVSRYGGISGVNGAYFCPADYKDCGGVNKTWADRISNGYNWSTTPNDTGPERVVFALDKNQIPFLYQKAHDYSKGTDDIFLVGKTINFDRKSDIYNGIGNHPLLLQDGINKIGESGAIDNKMESKSLKNFICSTQDGNIIYMGGVENATIYQMPDILKKLGCYNAINLDSGGSSAMMYNNKYIRGPGRNIMDALIIIPDKNYPIKSTISQDPKILKVVEAFKKIINTKFASLDDFTRKQKLFALNSKLNLLSKNSSEAKKSFYEALIKTVNSYIQ